jgi:hypothetical protein
VTRLLAVLALAMALAAGETPVLRPAVDGETLHAVSLRTLGLTFSDVVGKPVLAGDELAFTDCTARICGGTATAQARIGLSDQVTRLRADLAGVDLAAVIAMLGSSSAGTSGTISGWIELTLPPGGPGAITGEGEVTIAKGDLLRFGAFSSLLVGDPLAKANADTLTTRFSISGGRVQLKGATLRSPGAVVKFRGTIGLDGSLDLVAIPFPEFALLQVVPGIGDAAAWLLGRTSSRLARAVIRGQVGNPVVVINPFAD